eukprot:TRINITY_DN66002_c5_g3_i1.p2 TRINITY_DN66002_c5_g3~~TRINITY_DN66002_c5_g3_i1.p2  ORF type:complete len:205 (-),score=11.24 TRINITY_DN66002_c5_g3_i1:459-1073(-)
MEKIPQHEIIKQMEAMVAQCCHPSNDQALVPVEACMNHHSQSDMLCVTSMAARHFGLKFKNAQPGTMCTEHVVSVHQQTRSQWQVVPMRSLVDPHSLFPQVLLEFRRWGVTLRGEGITVDIPIVTTNLQHLHSLLNATSTAPRLKTKYTTNANKTKPHLYKTCTRDMSTITNKEKEEAERYQTQFVLMVPQVNQASQTAPQLGQ